MRNPTKRRLVMKRSLALGHCVCNPIQPCPCPTLIEKDLCPCAGERPEPTIGPVKLTRSVRKAGCASKISHKDLKRVLDSLPAFEDPNVLLGVAAGDDAGIYHLDGEFNLVQTVDIFTPVVDDAYLFGGICAANSLSDIYAMGGRPICALSIVGFPIETLPFEILTEIMRGGLEKMHEAGVSVIGGHSINDEETKCGFAVTGLIKGTGAVTNNGARAGDFLLLTKPIGTGFISFAAQLGRASAEAIHLAGSVMATLNRDAADLMLKYCAHACTDVTGFSLAGHLTEMALRSNLTALVKLSRIPIIAEALSCAVNGVTPGAVERNRESFEDRAVFAGEGDPCWIDLLFTPETSGGLLVAMPQEATWSYVEEMRDRGHTATAMIGEFVPRREHALEVMMDKPTFLIGPISEDNAPCSIGETPLSCCDHEVISDAREDSTQEMRGEQIMLQDHAYAESFLSFMKTSTSPGRLDSRTKRLLSIALSVSQRCRPCLITHIKGAKAQGITQDEIDEAAWLAIAFCGCPAKMFYEDAIQEIR